MSSPDFDDRFSEQLDTLLAWRRDVRHFRTDPVPDELLRELLLRADTAPSVGLSQPWRFVLVDDPERRARIRESFERSNADALSGYRGERAQRYAGLKLQGLDQAPVQLAVCCVNDTAQGHGLGRATMPETLAYSAVCAIQLLWLVARARGVGLGWVSILEPDRVMSELALPEDWKLIGYLCLGYPAEESDTPKLERAGWESRSSLEDRIVRR